MVTGAPMRAAALAKVLVLFGIGCQTPPQVVVHITADPDSAARASELTIAVYDADDAEVYRRSAPFTGPGAIARLDVTAARITVAPKERDVDRRFRLVATLVDDSGTPFVELQAAAGFEPGLREARIHFEDACAGVTCAGARTCSEGACAPICVVLSSTGATQRSQRRDCGCLFADDGQRCTADDGTDGQCRDNACCVGCWDGMACRDGRQDSACGAAGAECIECCDQCSSSGTCTEENVNEVEMREAHACAQSAGSVYCWGRNEAGQVGAGGVDDVCSPTLVVRNKGDTEVSGNFSCALGFGGDVGAQLVCWGNDDNEQLPYWTGMQDRPPAPAGSGWTQIALGGSHGCGIQVPGDLYCWGNCWNGQCGLVTDPDVGLPPLDSPTRVGTRSDWELVAASRHSTCGIAAGELFCWGHNVEGQAGQPFTRRIGMPTLVPHGEPWVTVSMAHGGTCAIDATDSLYCWGDVKGALVEEVSPTAALYEMVQVPGSYRRVAVGNSHTCAITTEGHLYCWGSNERGQLATNLSDELREGRRVRSGPIGFTFEDVAVGFEATCAVRSDGELFCWGSDDDCRIGGGGDTEGVRHICL